MTLVPQKTLQLFWGFLLSILATNVVSAQETLTGKVINKQRQPVAFVNATLLKRDSIFVEGTMTDSLGTFSFKAASGSYTLVLEQFGTEYFSRQLQLIQDLDLGEIEVNESVTLDGVIITTGKKLIEKKVDRLVFHVENSVAATGGSALDALKLTPRVKVQNDQISLIGKNGMSVMVDDRLVNLSGDDLANYLKTINSADVKSIEVITNPPAKYSAEGNSGLINIVTKKSKKDEWNASLRTTYKQATYATGTVGGNFNLKKGKLQLNTSIDYSNGSAARLFSGQVFYPDDRWDETSDRRDFSNYLSLGVEIEYKINSKLSTGFSYNIVDNRLLSKALFNTGIYNALNTLDSNINTKGRDNNKKNLNLLNYHFVYKIDSSEKKLSFDFDYFDFKRGTDYSFKTQTFLPDRQPASDNIIQAKSIGDQHIQNYAADLNMEHPTSWATLNYGARASLTQADNSFAFYNIEPTGQEYLDAAQSNRFNYKEATQAVYLSIQKELSDKWESKLGLRYERTQTEGISQTLNQTNTNDYAKLFPSFYLSFEPNKNHSLNINYGRRIQRPGFHLLNPFRWVFSPFSYSEGNPFLQPAFTHNVELGHGFKDILFSSLYFSRTDDNFEQVTIIDAATKVQQVVPQNFIINKTYGVNETANLRPVKWWNLSASADVYYSSTNSKIPVTLQYLSGWSGEFSISNDFTLKQNKTVFANISYWYTTKGVDNLDYNSSASQLDASVKWLLLNKKLTISLQANDILRSNGFTYTSFSNGIKNTFYSYHDNRYLRLSVIYNFEKSLQLKNRENKNADELNRAY